MSNYKQPAGEHFPPPMKVNSLQALVKLLPDNQNHKYGVFAFSLNRDMIKEDGTLDDLHAVVFHLGSFSLESDACRHAKEIMAKTGHPGIIVSRYGAAVCLSTKFDPNFVQEVALDGKGRLIELESAQYKREREEYEKRLKIERNIIEESEKETDIDHVEHFKRQCYLAIKNKSSWMYHKKMAEESEQNYKNREKLVRDHYKRHPEHEKIWLPYFKEKLIERGELDLYAGIETAYKEIRKDLLGIDHSDE